MRPLRLTVVLVLALIGVASGCGDDDDGGGDAGSDSGLSAEEEAYVDEAIEDFDPERDAPMTEQDARCVATSMVQGLGVERLEEIGITPESFSDDGDLPVGTVDEADATTLVDGIAECIDFRELFLAGFAEEGSISSETADCLAEEFDVDLVKRSMVVMMSEGEEALSASSGVGAEMMEAFLACPGAIE